tara:strand:+ start:171 stop:368 length:198 start_codon:yes stop_codon:yes gene_type:complete
LLLLEQVLLLVVPLRVLELLELLELLEPELPWGQALLLVVPLQHLLSQALRELRDLPRPCLLLQM